MSDIQKTYELACLVSPDLDETQFKTWLTRLRESIINHQGELVGDPYVREQKLAYPIAKRLRATLVVFRYTAPSATPDMVMNEIRHENDILRYLTITIPKERKRPVRVKKIKPESGLPPSLESRVSSTIAETRKDDLAEIDKRIEEILKSAS